MNAREKYREIYQKEPEKEAFCPYRICTLGAHIDHQLGAINGFAIDKGIHIAYGIKHNGIVELQSLNFPKRAQFFISSVEPEKVGDWADHLRGAALKLGEKYKLKYGLSGVIEGTLPIGGLSSSAAVIIAFLSALCDVNGITLSNDEIITIAKAAENDYVGVKCGKLDQSCEVLCKKDSLLFLDCLDDKYENIKKSDNMKEFSYAIFYSGVSRSLSNSGYNLRVDECKSAAYALKAYAGDDYGKYADTYLRDVPPKLFEKYGENLPYPWKKRAEHFFTEFERAKRGAKLWRKGDIESYGQLVFESGRSSIVNYECGCSEQITLYRLLTKQKGVYGARFSGAGFKGCCMALIDPEYSEQIEKEIGYAYLKEFPSLEGKYSFHLCESSDGVGSI